MYVDMKITVRVLVDEKLYDLNSIYTFSLDTGNEHKKRYSHSDIEKHIS
jgi:hypothetical protein